MKNRTQASVHLNALLRTRTSLSETRFTSAIPLLDICFSGRKQKKGKRLSKSTSRNRRAEGNSTLNGLRWIRPRAGEGAGSLEEAINHGSTPPDGCSSC